MLGRRVLSSTSGCTFLSHLIDPLFNEEWRWTGIKRKKKINAFSTLAAGVHSTLDSSLRVSKVLFIYFSKSVHKGRKSQGLGIEILEENLGTGKVHYSSLVAVVFWQTQLKQLQTRVIYAQLPHIWRTYLQIGCLVSTPFQREKKKKKKSWKERGKTPFTFLLQSFL